VDRRTWARELAVQALYQLDVQHDQNPDFVMHFLKENTSNPKVLELALEWTKGVWNNLKECDRLIENSVIRWHISRLSTVDKSILRLSVYQLKFCSDIPPKVVINEAIELAKKFSTAQSSGFVNGVLDSVVKKIKVECS